MTTPRKIKPTARGREAFAFYVQCQDVKRLPAIPLVPDGYTAEECFYAHETYGGALLPCREPELLSRALNGKEWHGLTVTNCAEDYIGRILFASDLKSNYPAWVQRDILGRAAQLAMERFGFVPTFVRSGEDFSTLKLDLDLFAP